MLKLIGLIMQLKIPLKLVLKKCFRVDTSKLEAKSYLAFLKATVDRKNIDKWKIVPVDLSNLSNVVNNDVAKKNCVIN